MYHPVRFGPRLRRTAAAVLVVIFACSVVACAPAQDDAKQPDTKQPEASAEAEKETDLYTVPDGTPEELLALVERLLNTTPPDQSSEGLAAHREKTIEAAMTATERVMESPRATHEQAARAAEIKLQILLLLAQAGEERADEKLEAFREQIRGDEREAVRMVVKPQELLQRLAGWRQLDEAAKQAWLEDVVAYLQAVELDSKDGRLVSYAMTMLEKLEDRDAAAALINKTAPVFQASDDEEIAAIADRLRGSLRFMNLEGTEMEIEGRLLGGGEFDWLKYQDKVVLVDFWATWCGPCIRELPNVIENYQRYHDKGFEVVGISLDTDAEQVKEFVEKRDIPWPILFSSDPEATEWDHPMAVKYGIQAIPAAILVDKSGKVVSKDARGEELGRHLQELLGDPLPVEGEQTATTTATSEDSGG